MYLRVVALWDEQMGKHLRAGLGGLIDFDDVTTWKMSLNDPVLKLLKRIQTDFKIKLDREDVVRNSGRTRGVGHVDSAELQDWREQARLRRKRD